MDINHTIQGGNQERLGGEPGANSDRPTKTLSDTALVLLNTAANREPGLLLPVAEGLKARGVALKNLLTSLLAKGLAEEAPVTTAVEGWRQDENSVWIGLRVTTAGLAAIGIEPASAVADDPTPPADESVESSRRRPSKQDTIIWLLSREEGASVDTLMAATGWLPHTVRAVLSGLRKKGHRIDRQKQGDGGSVYRILPSPMIAGAMPASATGD